MSRPTPRAAALAAAVLLLAACGKGDGAAADSEGKAPQQAAAPADSAGAAGAQGAQQAPPQGPTGPTTQLPPNEMGQFLVLEYHRLGNNEGEWVRSLANFRKDLELLYSKGYRPVTMRDMLDGNANIPAGTTPVVITFDDSTLGQFYLTASGDIDPNTMVGSWKAFKERNPAWSGGGVWCVLPAAGHPSNFFGEKPDKQIPREQREANIRKKVNWLVDNGHEICNHTLFHARLDRARDDAQVQEWLGVGEDSIKAYLPADYDIVTHALPLGMWPKNKSLAWRGTYRNGKTYEYRAVLEVAGERNPSPFDRRFDHHSINRFIVAPNALERQIERWEAAGSPRYVSDGDPNTVTFPAAMEQHLDRSRLGNRTAKPVQ